MQLTQNGETESLGRNESPIHQWAKLNKVLVAYKYALLSLSTLLLGFFLLTCWLVNRDTIVVGLTPNEKLFFLGERKEVKISESDVAEFAKLFIRLRYSWDSFRIENLAKELAPYTSDGLLQKIQDAHTKNKAMAAQTALAQDVLIRSVKLEEGRIVANLDRVIQISPKMKVVAPLDLTLTLIRGKPNRFNPLGLYVNQVVEHEDE